VHADVELANSPNQNQTSRDAIKEMDQSTFPTKLPGTTVDDFKSAVQALKDIPKLFGCEKPVGGPRVFQVNDCVGKRDRFCSNYVKTTRYTKWNFLPLCLFFQYTKVSNLYFLLSAIIQAIPIISPL